MIAQSIDLGPAMVRALAVGVAGGVALVLTMIYSRRGPMIYPVYGALIYCLALLLGRYPDLPFGPRILSAFTGLIIASLIAFFGVIVLGGQERRRLTGKVVEGRVPPWGFPLVFAILLLASLFTAFVTS